MKYRLVVILRSGLAKERQEKLIEKIKKILDAKSLEVRSLGEKKFAYPIKKEKSGEYLFFEFNKEKQNKDIDKKLNIEDDILRHILVRESASGAGNRSN
jgi:ribosomal protein S6